jgi:hypothetical protein
VFAVAVVAMGFLRPRFFLANSGSEVSNVGGGANGSDVAAFDT